MQNLSALRRTVRDLSRKKNSEELHQPPAGARFNHIGLVHVSSTPYPVQLQYHVSKLLSDLLSPRFAQQHGEEGQVKSTRCRGE